ncbi:penicillin binding protein [Anaerocolumna sedimenticola]|uniref:Penicillin binding protein n=1 Tax=Anaerocolumna sedimenticola TaxID=2696063 RepID=A0A6P1TIZ9_9FIRM|nr:M56 family metallopeptidase [Anaerocolumna sedimenticola]QHQ60403.1 penicillin binding protein [Anaerocolumna sedimenticola]
METLFLNIFNMSITAGYVILAVLLIRFLLKKAPKKYSYLLWSVVLFRLICPVSFTSVFSIFQTKPFDMTTALRGGRAALKYIPERAEYTSPRE